MGERERGQFSSSREMQMNISKPSPVKNEKDNASHHLDLFQECKIGLTSEK